MVPTLAFSADDWAFRPPVELLSFRAEATGFIREMHLWMDTIGAGWYVTVRRNGIVLLNGFGDGATSYMLMNPLTDNASKTGLAFPVSYGDLIDVRRISNGQFRIFPPATFLMITEES